MTGIGQLQTLAHLFQADAASAFICHAFGMIAVGYFAMYLSGAFTEVDTDKAGLSGGDAMLEGILYEGNKDERSYFRTAVRSDVYLCFHTDVGGETDAHQFDVVADEVHLLVQGDEVLLIVIQHMAQQSAQFLHGSLCLVGIEGDEGVDVVQRIEQEVRVELVAQVLQLGFRAAFLGFPAGGVHLRPAAAQLDGSAEAGGKNHGRDVAQDEYPFGRTYVLTAIIAAQMVLECVFLPKVGAGGNADDEQCVQQEILPDASLEQVAGNEEAVVDVEYKEEREGTAATVAQIVREADVEAAACHHQKGETDDDTPDNDVYQGFDAAAAWVRELLFHHDTKIQILMDIGNIRCLRSKSLFAGCG